MFGETDKWTFGIMTLEQFSAVRKLFATLVGNWQIGRARGGWALPQGLWEWGPTTLTGHLAGPRSKIKVATSWCFFWLQLDPKLEGHFLSITSLFMQAVPTGT